MKLEKQKSKFRWIVFISVLFTYLIMSVQRTAPGLITDQLMVEYQLTASTVGILASIHFFIFTSLQIPMGILVDRYGPDRILFIGSLLTGIGISIYSCSPNEYILLFARVLTGTGDATVWISIVLILSEWFQKNEFTRIIGFAGMTGSIGFLMATVPLSAWIDQNGWRIPFLRLGYC
jgi:MFS family permease